MVLLDVEGRVRSWNPGAQRIKGYAAEEILGQSFERFYPPEAVAASHPLRELEIASLVGRYEETGWRVRSDGSRFWARVIIVALRDDRGELTGYGKVTSDMTADRQRDEQVANTLSLLEQAIRLDRLTGLPNRMAWDEITERELHRAGPVAMAVIDLDHFKHVNDALGHEAGDAVLRRAAWAWQRTLLSQDTLARYGGEEFAVLLPGRDLAAALATLERLRLATPDGQTCSVGVASRQPGDTVRGLFARADRAMYAAKSGGRDRVAAG